ncbi:cupin domain-containing protein [Sphingomonas sp. LHG3406-1]|uniref:JmjC domain-containing protein n=1 Tax=Sphingomonas sp. LHG3406-1 TaxID=2804617 RepID=UPI002608BF68|nr:cupin domain-containing protein [Sphingomonas sp. LHG3406-1]
MPALLNGRLDLAALLAPVDPDAFRRDHFGRKPLHLKGGADHVRASIFGFDELNRLLAMHGVWTPQRLKLIINSAPVKPGFYLHERADGQSFANAAEVEVMLGLGASLVANQVEELSPGAGEAARVLGEAFAGHVEANAYCSFEGVQAFASHCDLHDVFAMQLHGTKEWRIYVNRALDPIEQIQGPGAQALIDKIKGPVLMQVRTEPGDLLYIPRGFYHDALASSSASLHLTFGLAPLHGMAVIQELQLLARELPEIRAYLPDGREDPAALDDRLARLADAIAGLVRSPRLRDQIRARQRRLAPRAHRPFLPKTPRLDMWLRTDRQAELVRDGDQLLLATAEGGHDAGPFEEELGWIIAQPAFAAEHLPARFPWLNEESQHRLLALVHKSGVARPQQG